MREFLLQLKYKWHGVWFILTHRQFIALSIAHGAGDDNYNVEYTFKMVPCDVVEAMDAVRPFFKECENLDETLHMAKRILLEASAPNATN